VEKIWGGERGLRKRHFQQDKPPAGVGNSLRELVWQGCIKCGIKFIPEKIENPFVFLGQKKTVTLTILELGEGKSLK